MQSIKPALYSSLSKTLSQLQDIAKRSHDPVLSARQDDFYQILAEQSQQQAPKDKAPPTVERPSFSTFALKTTIAYRKPPIIQRDHTS